MHEAGSEELIWLATESLEITPESCSTDLKRQRYVLALHQWMVASMGMLGGGGVWKLSMNVVHSGVCYIYIIDTI